MNFKKFCLLFVFCFSAVSYAADINEATEKEINHLLTYISSSHCEFNRNGDWYQSKKAVSHINRKYQYALRRGAIKSTEDFIRYAATESSFSGRAYKVRCDDKAEILSANWLNQELHNYREQQ